AVGGEYKRIAQAYDVNLLVTTVVVAEADHLQLDLQIVEPITRDTLWSNSFQGTRAQYLELTHQAGDGLRRALRSSEKVAAPAVEGGSEAELAFREGEHFLDAYNNRHDPADFDAALNAFQHTLQLNPKAANAA